MSGYTATYNDGETAAAHKAVVNFALDGLLIGLDDDGNELSWPYADLRSLNPVRSGQPVLLSVVSSPEGRLFISDPAAADLILQHAAHLSAKVKTRLMLIPTFTFAGVLAAFIGFLWVQGISPSRFVAERIPNSARTQIGEQLVKSMSSGRPACSRPEGVAALNKMIRRLSAGHPDQIEKFSYNVLPVGLVNAFAAPGEQIVITRGLLEFVKSPEELAGVVAHEIGHAVEIHPETSVVRALGVTAIATMILGGSDFGSLGALLVQFGFSRSAEREADAHAVEILRKANISTRPFSRFFRRLQLRETGGLSPKKSKSASTKSQKVAVGLGDIFRTHPATPERITYIENAALTQKSGPHEPVLSASEWAALKEICDPLQKEKGNAKVKDL